MAISKTHLILEIVPPVRPSLLNAAFLLDNSILNDGTKNTESHCDAMVVIAVDTRALL